MMRLHGAVLIALLGCVVAAGPARAHDPALGTGDANPVEIGSSRTGDGVTFESLGLPNGDQVDPPDGVATTVDGYTFTPGPNNDSGFNDSHFGNAVTFWPYNGTHVALFHDDVIMTKEGGGPFDLMSFDMAGFPTGNEVTFTVTGQPGNVVATFTPDGVVDGVGGQVDFETFTVPGTFTGLTSVTWEHSGPATLSGLFGLDNIILNKPVSVDSKSWGSVKDDYR